jgi:hypothetical protein
LFPIQSFLFLFGLTSSPSIIISLAYVCRLTTQTTRQRLPSRPLRRGARRLMMAATSRTARTPRSRMSLFFLFLFLFLLDLVAFHFLSMVLILQCCLLSLLFLVLTS